VVEFRLDASRTLVAANATFGDVRQVLAMHRDEFEVSIPCRLLGSLALGFVQPPFFRCSHTPLQMRLLLSTLFCSTHM
jgi:hypothetical protein